MTALTVLLTVVACATTGVTVARAVLPGPEALAPMTS